MTTLSLPRRPFVDAVLAAAHGDYIRLSVEDAVSAIVTGADMYTTTSTMVWAQLPLDVVASSVTLPTKLLVATAKALQGDDVELAISTSRCRLRSGSYRAEIAAQGRLPAVQQVPEQSWRSVDAGAAVEFSQALRCVKAAMLSDPARPAVSGVRVDLDGSVVGTDGNRMHHVTTSWPGGYTLPSSCVDAAVDVLAAMELPKATKPKRKGGADGTCPSAAVPELHLAIGANNVAFRLTTPTATRTLFCRRAPEPFSEWRRIATAATTSAATLTLDRDVLATTLKSCPADAISICPTPLRLLLDYVVYDATSTRRLGEGSVEVAVKTSSIAAAAPVGFAVKVAVAFLRDAVACCGDEVVLEMSPSQPLRVRCGRFQGVVMFMR